MSSFSLRRPGFWITATLSSLCLVTGMSFVRAQFAGGNVPTFRPGGGVPVRGVPIQQRQPGVSFPGPGGTIIGPVPRPAAVMPDRPNVTKGFPGQNNTPPNNPNFFGFGGQNPNQQGNQGGALGSSGSTSGSSGTSGTTGSTGSSGSSGTSGGQTGGFAAQGQNFQNPTGIAGFPQAPVGYFGGTTGGLITGSGIAGIAGQQQQGSTGQQGTQGGVQGSGGFGSGGFGGGTKGLAGAGNNGI